MEYVNWKNNTINSFNKTSSLDIEIWRWNVSGITPLRQLWLNPAVWLDFEDVWCKWWTLIYPTTAETWEIVSDNANDSASWTWARTVQITTLDANYVEQAPITITLNGTTPVTISWTHFRHVSSRVMTWGSTWWNEWEITIRAVWWWNPRTCIKYDTVGNIGFNVTQDLFLTVPAWKTFYPASILVNSTKNHDVIARNAVRFFGEDWFNYFANFSVYQDTFQKTFSTLARSFPEKTDIKFIARSNNAEVAVTVIIEWYFIDN